MCVRAFIVLLHTIVHAIGTYSLLLIVNQKSNAYVCILSTCMALENSIKVSNYVYDELEQIKEQKDHGSFDSAIRELLQQ